MAGRTGWVMWGVLAFEAQSWVFSADLVGCSLLAQGPLGVHTLVYPPVSPSEPLFALGLLAAPGGSGQGVCNLILQMKLRHRTVKGPGQANSSRVEPGLEPRLTPS